MKFFDAIKSGFSNYANFKGRARRSEFWYFTLFYFLACCAIPLIGLLLTVDYNALCIVESIFILPTIVPRLSLTWRRLHDTGHNGWEVVLAYAALLYNTFNLLLVSVLSRAEPKIDALNFWGKAMMVAVPILVIRFIVLLAKDSKPGENKYGPNPKDRADKP